MKFIISLSKIILQLWLRIFYHVCSGTVVMYCLPSIPYLRVVMLVLLLKLFGDTLKLIVTCDIVAL